MLSKLEVDRMFSGITMRSFFVFLALLHSPLASAAQTTPSPQLQPRPSMPKTPPGGTQQQLTLDVQVTDHSGAPVRGLQQQDFTLLDDERPQSITSFRSVNADTASADNPVEVFVVIDAVNTTFQTVNYERAQIKQFLLRDDGRLEFPTSLIVVSDTGTKVQNSSSRDGNAVAAIYDQYETGLRSITRSAGFYGASERFDLSFKALSSLTGYMKTRAGRKLVIWFSPGWPTLSGPGINLSRKNEEQIFSSIVDASTQLREARVTVYAIDPLGVSDSGSLRPFYYREFLKSVTSPSHAQVGNLALQVLALQSGGLVFNGSNDLAEPLARCASDADDFYVLSFGAVRSDQPNEYHAITVKVGKPSAIVRTRAGYYAQP
jgi:VWFA-related protein